MNRYVISTVIFFVVTLFVGAQAPKVNPSPAQLAQLLQRNYSIIDKLVDSSIQLATERDAFQKTMILDPVISVLEQQVIDATKEGDNSRVSEMGKHLQSVLKQGMLPTMEAARKTVSPGSVQDEQLKELEDRMDRVKKRVDESLKNPAGNPDAPVGEHSLKATKLDVEKDSRPNK